MEICNKKSKNTAIIGDSMLNNINGKGLSKSKKVNILNILGATSDDIVDQVDDVVEGKPLSFSNIIIRRDKRHSEKRSTDTNSSFKNFCYQKNLHLILNDNMQENHVSTKKLHLNRKGISIFSKNLLNII